MKLKSTKENRKQTRPRGEQQHVLHPNKGKLVKSRNEKTSEKTKAEKIQREGFKMYKMQ